MILTNEQIKLASEAAVEHNRFDVFPLLESHREQSKLIAEQEKLISGWESYYEKMRLKGGPVTLSKIPSSNSP